MQDNLTDTRIGSPLQPDCSTTDPDLGPIGPGHVCKHGIQWPHECRPCADANWAHHQYQQQQKKRREFWENRHSTILEWSDPWPACDKDGKELVAEVTYRATVHDCVNMGRASAKAMGRDVSGPDDEFLIHFCVTNHIDLPSFIYAKYGELDWEKHQGEDSNDIWTAPGPYKNEDGTPQFMWSLQQKLEENRIVWYDTSPPELNGGNVMSWGTLEEAKRAIDMAHFNAIRTSPED